MKRALIGVSALALSVACTEGGRSVVLVDVSAGPSVTTAIDSVIVHVTRGGTSLHHADVNEPLPLKVGVYLPKEVSGSVDIEVCAFRNVNGTREVVQVSNDPANATVTVTPGSTVGPARAVLDPRPAPEVCGGMSTGRGGTGGGGGTGGAAGMGGSVVAGTGGGGAAGTGGVGGTTGLAGNGGAGGTSSLAGRGGTTGLAGRGGTTGTAGTGGLAGRGGTTGTAGTGGTATASDWRGQLPVSASSTYADKNPSVAVAPSGRAVVVFERDGQIQASCYDPAGPSWSGSVPIGGSGVYQMPVVAVDGVGRFTAVWTQGTGSGFPSGTWSATTSTDCTKWTGGPNPLSSVFASQAALAVNGDGLAVAAWVESGYVNARMRSSPTTDWLGAHALQFGNNVQRPAVAMGTVGAFVVWQEASSSTGLDTIYFNWAALASGGSWQPSAAPVPSDSSIRAFAPAIAVNGNTVIVTYLHQTLTGVELWARPWSGGAFGAAQRVSAASVTVDSTVPPSVTLDDNGTATVAWAATVGTQLQAQASREDAGSTTWLTTPMESDNQAMAGMGGGQAPMPSVRGDGKGNVFVIWRKRGTGSAIFDLFARRYTPGTTWGPEMKIDATDLIGGAAASVTSPVLGMNGSGVAVAAWYYDIASPDVYAAVTR